MSAVTGDLSNLPKKPAGTKETAEHENAADETTTQVESTSRSEETGTEKAPGDIANKDHRPTSDNGPTKDTQSSTDENAEKVPEGGKTAGSSVARPDHVSVNDGVDKSEGHQSQTGHMELGKEQEASPVTEEKDDGGFDPLSKKAADEPVNVPGASAPHLAGSDQASPSLGEPTDTPSHVSHSSLCSPYITATLPLSLSRVDVTLAIHSKAKR